jgi:hypothetical protein
MLDGCGVDDACCSTSRLPSAVLLRPAEYLSHCGYIPTFARGAASAYGLKKAGVLRDHLASLAALAVRSPSGHGVTIESTSTVSE